MLLLERSLRTDPAPTWRTHIELRWALSTTAKALRLSTVSGTCFLSWTVGVGLQGDKYRIDNTRGPHDPWVQDARAIRAVSRAHRPMQTTVVVPEASTG